MPEEEKPKIEAAVKEPAPKVEAELPAVQKKEEIATPAEKKFTEPPAKVKPVEQPSTNTSTMKPKTTAQYYRGSSNPGIIGEGAMTVVKKLAVRSTRYPFYAETGSVCKQTYGGLAQMNVPVLVHPEDINDLNGPYLMKRHELLRVANVMIESLHPSVVLKEQVLPLLSLGSTGKDRALRCISMLPCDAINYTAFRSVGSYQKEGQLPPNVKYGRTPVAHPGMYGRWAPQDGLKPGQSCTDPAFVTSMTYQNIYAPLAYLDLMRLMWGIADKVNTALYTQKTAGIQTTIMEFFADEYITRLTQDLKDIHVEELATNSSFKEYLEFLEMYYYIDHLPWMIGVLANSPYCLSLLTPQSPLEPAEQKSLYEWLPDDALESCPMKQAATKWHWDELEGLQLPGTVDPRTGFYHKDVVFHAYPTAIMIMKHLKEKMATVIPRLLAFNINLANTELEGADIEGIETFLSRLQCLMELISMIPEMTNMVVSDVHEEFNFAIRGHFSGYTFYPHWHRVQYTISTYDEDKIIKHKGKWTKSITGTEGKALVWALRLHATTKKCGFFNKYNLTWLLPYAVTSGHPGGSSISVGQYIGQGPVALHTVVDPSQLGWLIYTPVLTDLNTYARQRELMSAVTEREMTLYRMETNVFAPTKSSVFASKTNLPTMVLTPYSAKEGPLVLPLSSKVVMSDPQSLNYLHQPTVVLREMNGPTKWVYGPALIPANRPLVFKGSLAVTNPQDLVLEDEIVHHAPADPTRMYATVDWARALLL